MWRQSALGAVGLLALSHMLLLYPTLRPNSQWLGPVITRFRTPRRELWLTIDDGPADDTAQILALFERTGVKATFFVKGMLADANPELVRQIVSAGHTVANHSHTHPSASFWFALPGQIARELDECNGALERATGAPPTWFRAPVGHKNPFVHPALRRRNMQLIGWSARAFDAVLTDPRAILSRLLPQVAPGAILLMHQGRPHSVDTLAMLVDTLTEQGYRFVIPGDEQLTTS